MESTLATSTSATGPVTFSHVFGQQCQLMEAAVQSLHTLNDQISHFIVTKSKALEEDQDLFLPTEKETLKSSMMLMRHLLMDAQRSPIRNWTTDSFQCISSDPAGF
uniref:Kazrin, periplakin interacting protein n=1 Tax=Phocoena sinus TaxID=42100 RepID=A0A8C9C8U9_PHOSS